MRSLTDIAPYLFTAILAFAAGWSVNGWRLGEQMAQQERDIAQEREKATDKARAIESLSASLSDANAARYAAEQAAQQAKATIITKEVTRYVQEPYAGHCQLPNRWLRLDTAAATGVPADRVAIAGPDDAPSGATDSDVLELNVERASLCRDQAIVLIGLQNYVRDQLGLCNGAGQ